MYRVMWNHICERKPINLLRVYILCSLMAGSRDRLCSTVIINYVTGVTAVRIVLRVCILIVGISYSDNIYNFITCWDVAIVHSLECCQGAPGTTVAIMHSCCYYYLVETWTFCDDELPRSPRTRFSNKFVWCVNSGCGKFEWTSSSLLQ